MGVTVPDSWAISATNNGTSRKVSLSGTDGIWQTTCEAHWDKSSAKAAYEAFFTAWKDADPDLPVLKQAKAEYAKLQ
ncbi:MAG TPA: hypothetical protein VJ756_22915 [Terriglobales bacterium]|nr:hypothetical protein [Terriglobales bacterium]